MPVAGSLRGYVSDYPAVLVCEMSDGTKRLVVTSRGVPVGNYNSEYQIVEMSVDPSPAPFGTTEERPPTVPFDFADYSGIADNYPFEPILAELLFTNWLYDSEEESAFWSANLFAGGVDLSLNNEWIVAGDTSAVANAIFG